MPSISSYSTGSGWLATSIGHAPRSTQELYLLPGGIDSGVRLGRYRWVVERTLAWLNRYRRLEVRDERREATHQAFLTQGCALIGWHFIERFC